MDNKSDEQFIIMQLNIEANEQDMKSNQQDSDEEMMKLTASLKEMIASTVTTTMDQMTIQKSSPDQKFSKKSQDPNIVVPANKRAMLLPGEHSTKIGGMWNLKHDIRSTKFYELFVKTELKGNTALYLKNFYNYIKMCLSAVTIL